MTLMIDNYQGTTQSPEIQLSGQKKMLSNIDEEIEKLHDQWFTLLMAQSKVESAQRALDEYMKGDYVTLQIVTSENRGSRADVEKMCWDDIHTETYNLNNEVQDVLDDINEAIRKKDQAMEKQRMLRLATERLIADLESQVAKQK